MTALAGLAVMAGGSTPVEGEYAANLRRAVDFLLASTNANGLIAHVGEEQRSMHGHGFAMLFLAQAYGVERDPTRQARIKGALRKAIDLTGKSQSAAGGWLYSPDSGGDEGSVTVTQIQGLRACRNAGIFVPKSIVDKAMKYIEDSANPDGGIRYRVSAGASRPAITAAAVATMYNAGAYEHPVAEKSLAYLKNHLEGKSGASTFGGHQYYATLYAGQAMYLSSEANWASYFPHTRDWLLQSQADDGSWQGDGVGQTYGTAIALLTLLLPYERLPILQR
jgi:squalene cyclase